MVNVTFYLDIRNRDKKGFYPVKANISVKPITDPESEEKVKSKNVSRTVAKIKSKHWHEDKRELKPPKTHELDSDYEKLYERLKNLKESAPKFFNQCEKQNIPITIELAKDFLAGKITFTEQKNVPFWTAYDEYLKAGQQDKSYNTNRNRKTIYNKIKDFEADTGYKMTWHSVNLVFWDRMKEYILEDKDHGYNYLSAIAAKFKAFMKWSQRRKYHNNDEYKEFSAPEKEITIVHLTWNELQHLLYFPFESKKYQKVRDFFCFGCLTGQRYIDLAHLTKENLVEDALKLTQQKTNKEVIIPMYKGVQTSVNRYPDLGRLLPKFSNQKLNDYIKEACEIAEINAITEFKSFKKNTTIKDYKPKHQLISSHTARKTFICLAYEKGMDIEMIKAITGITREKTLKRYLQISAEKKKEQLTAAFGKL